MCVCVCVVTRVCGDARVCTTRLHLKYLSSHIVIASGSRTTCTNQFASSVRVHVQPDYTNTQHYHCLNAGQTQHNTKHKHKYDHATTQHTTRRCRCTWTSRRAPMPARPWWRRSRGARWRAPTWASRSDCTPSFWRWEGREGQAREEPVGRAARGRRSPWSRGLVSGVGGAVACGREA